MGKIDLHQTKAQHSKMWTAFIILGVYSGLIPGLRPANERRCYFVTTSLIDWVQT